MGTRSYFEPGDNSLANLEAEPANSIALCFSML